MITTESPYQVRIYSVTGEHKQDTWNFDTKQAASRFANKALKTREKLGAVLLDSSTGFHIIELKGQKWVIKVVEG